MEFETVLELVSRRDVYLLNGFAYIPARLHWVLFRSRFSNSIMDSLRHMLRTLPYIINPDDPEEEERLGSFLRNLSTEYMGKTYTTGSGEVKATDINAVTLILTSAV